MAQRIIELYLPLDNALSIRKEIAQHEVLGNWQQALEPGRVKITVLIDAQRSEALLDKLSLLYPASVPYRVVILPVEASFPEAPEASYRSDSERKAQQKVSPKRLSRDELYNDVQEMADIGSTHFILVLMSAIVAAIGMLRDNVAVIVGAMVIAPLLGPNMALALASSLGDMTLAKRALSIGIAGSALAWLVSFGIGWGFGWGFSLDFNVPEITSRTSVNLADVVLALASGTAGALSLATGGAAAIIGVMVAVALMPPLVVFGMLSGAGMWHDAAGAAFLFICNVVCINLAAIVTFTAQSLRPADAEEEVLAKLSRFITMGLWLLALFTVVTIIALFAS